ncbi:MAG: MarR family transcriptional regulator [Myxococcaceae bacterium]|nr:MarR family transcriptional regulator [Myxococcaceae bacterium]
MNIARGLAELERRQQNSLGFLLIRCGHLWNERAIGRVNAEAGRPVLRESHTKLLPWLQAPEGIRITDLAQAVGVTKQAVQPLVAELAREGIVDVSVDPDDARARRVTLTPKGVEAMRHGTGVLETLENELGPTLGKGEARELKRLLRGLLRALEPSGNLVANLK